MRKNTNNGEQQAPECARRVWLAHAACLGMSLALPSIGRSAGPGNNKPAKASPKTHYLVSAILREGVQDFTFRLVHSVQTAASVDEATGLFTRLVLERYPGYAIAQTTVTDITLPPGTCAAGKPGNPRKPGLTLYIVSAAMSNSSAKDLDTLLVNGWLPGKSADEALARVLSDVKARYPGFTPASTLVTELDLTLAGCPAPGPVRSVGDRA